MLQGRVRRGKRSAGDEHVALDAVSGQSSVFSLKGATRMPAELCSVPRTRASGATCITGDDARAYNGVFTPLQSQPCAAWPSSPPNPALAVRRDRNPG